MVVRKPALHDSTINQIRAGWSDRLELDPMSLENSGLTLIPREGSSGITALKLLDSIVVICQPALFPTMATISPEELFDMPPLLNRLAAYTANPIGVASISYADVGTLEAPRSVHVAHQGKLKDVDFILSTCTEEEQEESDVSTMPTFFVAESDAGEPTSVAGYETWNGKIAQIGVLTRPEHRGKGYAAVAAQAVVQHALNNHLVPQWRCRIGNSSSDRLSQNLGFRKVGLQLAIDVVPVLD